MLWIPRKQRQSFLRYNSQIPTVCTTLLTYSPYSIAPYFVFILPVPIMRIVHNCQFIKIFAMFPEQNANRKGFNHLILVVSSLMDFKNTFSTEQYKVHLQFFKFGYHWVMSSSTKLFQVRLPTRLWALSLPLSVFLFTRRLVAQTMANKNYINI